MSWSNINILFFIILFSGCSYLPKSNIVPQDNSTIKNSNINIEESNKSIKEDIRKEIYKSIGLKTDDELLIQAIFYELNGKYKISNIYYNILYNKTGGIAYLIRELTTALYAGINSPNIDKLKELEKIEPENIQYKRLLLSFYINNEDVENGKVLAENLLQLSNMAIDYELSASPYILDGKYQKAVELLQQAYNRSFNEDILIKITTIYADFLNNPQEAKKRLEEYRGKFGCSPKVCNQLLEIYSKTEDIKPLIDIYKALYKNTKIDIYGIKLVETYIYIKDFNKAIKFLEREYKNNELLYEVYLAKKDYIGAQKVADKLYKLTKKPRWLAESAMALYEASEDKRDENMLDNFIDRFEKALDLGIDDSVYLNYYGYTLIDKSIDIQKGVKLIERALEYQPNNSYYLDSLAWGYYKLNMCQKALNAMKKVIDIEGIEEEDIAMHWRAIQKCESKEQRIGKNFR